MNLLDRLLKRKKQEEEKSIEDLSEREKKERFGLLSLLESELNYSITSQALELDKKREKDRCKIYT